MRKTSTNMSETLSSTPDVGASEDIAAPEVTNDNNQDAPTMETATDEEAQLEHLDAVVQDQDELERTVGRQADQMLLEQADERDQKRLEKTEAQKRKLRDQIRKLQQRLRNPQTQSAAVRTRAEVEALDSQIAELDTDLAQITKRMSDRHKDAAETETTDNTGNKQQPGESRREFLIRTGKITPFSRMGQPLQKTSSNLADVMLDAEENGLEEYGGEEEELDEIEKPMSHRVLLKPGFADDEPSHIASAAEGVKNRPRKKRRLYGETSMSHPEGQRSVLTGEEAGGSEDEYDPDSKESNFDLGDSESDSMAVTAQGTEEDDRRRRRGVKPKRRKRVDEDSDEAQEDLAGIDDGNERLYQARLQRWVTNRKAARQKAQGSSPEIPKDTHTEHMEEEDTQDDKDEWYMPHPTRTDAEFQGGLRIPGDIYPSLFDYQKTGVQWLWELYSQQVGGIVGDEMGLGKTIQVISFLAGLHYCKMLEKPVIVVCPATVMKQWVNEFHRWWPPLRVSILHTSGSGMLDTKREARLEDDLENWNYATNSKIKGTNKAAKRVVDRVLKDGHVLVTTYSGLQSYAELLIPVDWGYAILDEGHKIRNPNAGITIFCKELRTSNRVILSGTPMQNNLTELWSLFDFVFPMRLGTLVNFRNQFEIPIRQGGYANASNVQVETAFKCAETLKDSISPYLLQRFKVDVAADLPQKKEQVLFCRLTKQQRTAYEEFLGSEEMNSIAEGKRQSLYGIDILRKICNHPDLVDHKRLSIKQGYSYGNPSKSGKMQVVKDLIQLWKDTGHKTLLFAQHRIMLDILESFIRSIGGFNYRRMDGNTAIKDRQDMVDEFNNDPDLHVFLLTTKVGGLGVNLTGADRVIIYDPDWNPSTDVQARERAWRLGQKREVRIYRLMTVGSIEEKIYHRQIFKQFLTNKILRDPKQRQTFQMRDLHDLFTLGDANDGQTETSTMFKNTEVKFDDNENAAAVPDPINPLNSHPDDADQINNIVGISKQEAFHDITIENSSQSTPQPGQSPAPADNSSTSNSDSRIMSALFGRAGVHSALEHDEIVSGSGSSTRKIAADAAIVAQEAKRVAAQAAKALKENEIAARNLPAGTPSWTGTYGTAGRPEEDGHYSHARGGRGGRGGPSSSAVLANLSARQNAGPIRSNVEGDSLTASNQPKGSDFLRMIRDYLQVHGGSAYTQMLIDHFNRYCGTPARTAEFKEMLREIAVLEKPNTEHLNGRGRGGRRMLGSRAQQQGQTRGGRGKWVLKQQFGGTA